ncbi:MAG: polysaccharide biosynthesis C-terminal domain-containing protein, partial [Deltaproteobacteria bacterium]|nr:polysaccharide biosynthesis C-terminal domain-containing protein [Deltaproteobacteria bacterium]
VLSAICLWSVAFSRVITQAFYALKDAKTPVIIAFFTVIINLLLSVWLMNTMEYRGLALATSISAYFNTFYLLYALRKKIGKIGLKAISVSFAKALTASGIMGVIIALVFKNIMLLHRHYSGLNLAFLLLLAILLGIASYGAVSYLLKTQELKDGLAIIKRKLVNPH